MCCLTGGTCACFFTGNNSKCGYHSLPLWFPVRFRKSSVRTFTRVRALFNGKIVRVLLCWKQTSLKTGLSFPCLGVPGLPAIENYSSLFLTRICALFNRQNVLGLRCRRWNNLNTGSSFALSWGCWYASVRTLFESFLHPSHRLLGRSYNPLACAVLHLIQIRLKQSGWRVYKYQ